MHSCLLITFVIFASNIIKLLYSLGVISKKKNVIKMSCQDNLRKSHKSLELNGSSEICFFIRVTLMDKSIHTPVKRQYINALFEMAVYQRISVATIFNFLSLISIDIKGFPFDFGRKIFTGFEMAELESNISTFFLYFNT